MEPGWESGQRALTAARPSWFSSLWGLDNSNRSNWMSNLGLDDITNYNRGFGEDGDEAEGTIGSEVVLSLSHWVKRR